MKENGLEAEVNFPILCYQKNWEVSIPNYPRTYDFVVKGIEDDKFNSVQVKQIYGKRYRISLSKRIDGKDKLPYEVGDFDYLAAFDPNESEWYIIPWEKVSNIKSEITFKGSKWDAYKTNQRRVLRKRKQEQGKA